jgi:23S rRNA pseudouridine955/2504/2580 synthase
VERRIIGVKVAAAGANKKPGVSPHPAVQQLQVDEESAGQRLDNFLLRHLKGVPKTHVYRVIRSGEVRVNKGRASADTRVAAGRRGARATGAHGRQARGGGRAGA